METRKIADYQARNLLPSLEQQYDLDKIFNYKCLLLYLNEERAEIGVTDDIISPDLNEMLKEFYFNKQLVFYLISNRELISWLNEVSATMGDKLIYEHNGSLVSNNSNLDYLPSDAPIINAVNLYIIDALRDSASDIHFDLYASHGVVRYRKHGQLYDVDTINLQLYNAICSRIKIMANLNSIESSLPQDGVITSSIENQKVEIRVSTAPVLNGESIALRFYNILNQIYTLENLGFKDTILKKIQHIIVYKRTGLICITGSTGSGKTTTIYSLLNKLLEFAKLKIISIEDPIENQIDGVTQIPVNDILGLTFSSILRSVLRQDPDVIMVGEIRDSESASLAIQAALTGHLVITTLHARSAYGIIPRFINLGVEPYLLSSVFMAGISQSLEPDNCTYCSGRGCFSCNNTGVTGRKLNASMLVRHPELEELIMSGASSETEIEQKLQDYLIQ